MRKTRMFAAGVSLAALLGAAAAAGGPASAQSTNGVGTTKATTTALNVSLGTDGSLLHVSVLGDNGTANIDPTQGKPSQAASSLAPLTSSSQVFPSISSLNEVLPAVSVASTGAADNKSVPSVDLTTPLSTGSISPLSLSAAVDATQGAASGLSSALKNVTAAGGLLSVPSATSSLGAAAKPGDADGLRGLSVPSLQVLNLGATLQGLGVSSSALQLGQLGAVLTHTGITVPFGASSLSGSDLVTQITGVANTLTNTPLGTPPGISGVPGATLISALPPAVQTIVTGLFPGGTLPAGVTDVTSLVTALNTQITTLLNSALGSVTNAPLLQVNNLVVGVTTKAADTVGDSVADIQASLGSAQVGNLPLPGADLGSVVTNANAAVNQVLTDAGLGNLVTIKALDQSKSIGTQSNYVNALANLTGVHVAIAPLSSLAGGSTAAASPTDTLGSLYTLAGAAAPPALSGAMQTLNTLVATNALAQGATVDVLQVGSTSTFTTSSSTPSNPSAATPASGTLAVTGGPTQILGLVGLLLLAAVAGLRWLRRPATTN